MEKWEEILLAAFDLAAQKGLGNVSMSQIAEKAGIRKASVYNHFSSKEELIEEMYIYLRSRAKNGLSGAIDPQSLIQKKSAREILLISVKNYAKMNEDENMQKFYKLVYSQRAIDPAAAKIMAEETRRMIEATKALFYALEAHGKFVWRDKAIDMSATAFALGVHSILDYMLDCKNSGEACDEKMLEDYVEWFCEKNGGLNDEYGFLLDEQDDGQDTFE
ncbi:MAG: TetR/AcrR family transcriptional regulator [Ruminococcus sp.]|nr:TetR/AcrR family transcriptional regulator [Ruminococcus sp.]